MAEYPIYGLKLQKKIWWFETSEFKSVERKNDATYQIFTYRIA